MKEVLDYLTLLEQNNNRFWFQKNKEAYQKALQAFELVTDKLIHALRLCDNSLPDLDPGQCIFRIYRDIRFSKDKTPYKDHFGAFIAYGGRKTSLAGYYLHLMPGGSFLGGGCYRPSAENLKKIRKDIFDNPEEFLGIIQDKNFVDHFAEMKGEKLIRVPVGFPSETPVMEWLKHKSYTVIYPLEDDVVLAPDFISTAVRVFCKMTPLIHFLNYALRNDGA